MDLTVYVETIVRNFSRYHKYTLGSDLRQQRRELVTLIIRANSRPDKLPVLHDLREWLEAFQVLLKRGTLPFLDILLKYFPPLDAAEP